MKYILLSILLVFCTALFQNNASSQKNQEINIPIQDGSNGANDNNRLPQAVADRCAGRQQYRILSERYGEMAIFKFDNSRIKDYLLGALILNVPGCIRT